jgi:hypothetical protein
MKEMIKNVRTYRGYANLLSKPRSFMLGMSYATVLLMLLTSASSIFAYRFLGVY